MVSWAQKIVDRFGSYTELSPSGKGLHILCKGTLPGKGVKKNQVEMYDRGRVLHRYRLGAGAAPSPKRLSAGN